MVIIAIVNVIFAYFVFNKNKNRELTNKLILDYSIEHFYKYFDELEEELEKIKNKNISNTDKKQLEKNIQSLGRVLEHKFIDLFLYVNGTLHENIKHDIDDMVGVLTESLFDEGINLSVETKFNEKIATPIVTTKSKILKLLFDSSK
jgi:hypothetical protein